ncbi:MAG TPA: biotin--[acetyl-CoA-carboxylase] ligase [Lapillicoccus sp.]|nr:biotin--[acetyl-CoA-carboxylase] ligase [Lapillicoccus sp.]
MAASLDRDALYAALVTSGSPWRDVEHHATIGSTNARAAWLAEPWRVVVSDHQSEGRGRLARTWEAPPGTSVAVSATVPVPEAGQAWLPLLAGVAVAEAVTSVAELPAELKWPNDVLLPSDGDRKVCGVLCEVVQAPSGGCVVIGAGINLDQDRGQLPVDTATSLALGGAPDVDRNRLVAAYLAGVARWYAALTGGDAAGLRDAYRERCTTIGRAVTLTRPTGPDLLGTAVAVDDDGRLVVEAADGQHAWAAGDVTHVRSSG